MLYKNYFELLLPIYYYYISYIELYCILLDLALKRHLLVSMDQAVLFLFPILFNAQVIVSVQI